MNISRLSGLFAIIPTTLLLAVSFFVLLVLRKVEEKGLKAFGYVVAALLWASALLIFSAGIYTLSTGRQPAICMMQEMMQKKMHQMMPQGQMSDMRMRQRQMKQQAKPEADKISP